MNKFKTKINTPELKWKNIIQNFSQVNKTLWNWWSKNKSKIKILIPIAIISIVFMIFMVIKTIITGYNLNKESQKLYDINKYNTKILQNNDYTKEAMQSINTLNELIEYELNLSNEIKKYNSHLSILQNPYENFMQYILLPQLNIWKNPFTKEINTSLIGQKFLENNPYNDITLLQKWSNFVQNVWENNEFNDIESIVIGDIIEQEENFYIPINIKFISNSKRSFLLLMEKLSITSHQKNISLINEFIYNLWSNIKENNKNKLSTWKSESSLNLNEDEYIGYLLYQWVFNNEQNQIIDEKNLDQAIRDTMVCNGENDSVCFYKFRDKYRWIPSLAYTVGLENNKNKLKDFKKFLYELAPIIKINVFKFERHLQQDIKNFENIQYKGEIQMDVYGKWINEQEVIEIAEMLWAECLWNTLSPKYALNKIESTIINIWSIVNVETNNASNLRELQTIIENINQEYEQLSNYKKIIKLFEIYRMLKDGNLCNN